MAFRAPSALLSTPPTWPLISPLEPRLMMYSFTLTDGALRLDGDDTSQTLRIALVGDKVRATLKEGARQLAEQQWTLASVRSIVAYGLKGDDYIQVGATLKKPVTLGGFEGNDTLIGGGGNDTLSGAEGDDWLDGGGGGDFIAGAGGVDTVDYSSRTRGVTVTLGDQVADLASPSGNDGEAGEGDRVGDSNDRILGGAGNDKITGSPNVNAGNYLAGGDGQDQLIGLAGNDTLVGGDGNDRLDGGAGRDALYGDADKDTLLGGSGNDTLRGGKGIDQLFGNDGTDRLAGRDGQADRIDGGGGSDILQDRDDQDTLVSVP